MKSIGTKKIADRDQLAREGPDVTCILKGIGEYKEVRALYVKRAKEALCRKQ